MTVIAYDGRFVAADRLMTNDNGMMCLCRKIEVFDKQVMASAGAADHGEALMMWFKMGCKPAAFPFPREPHEKGSYLYVFKKGVPVQMFQTWPTPVIVHSAEFAAGSGNEIARTAMHLGRDARQAVAIANELSCYCGGGVDYVDLVELETTGTAIVRTYETP